MLPIKASVLLLTYNQEAFVAEALQSLLEQDYESLEIVVSDDCSQDATWRVVEQTVAAYQGAKKVVLNRNSQNLGVADNYNKAFSLASGDVIFSAAGDDISLKSRCSDCISTWCESGRRADLVATDAWDMTLQGEVLAVKVIDELGEWNVERWFEQRPYHFGASHMLTRRLLELGLLQKGLSAEDQCLVFRALLMGGAMRLPRALVRHRQNGVSSKVKHMSYDEKNKRLLKGFNEALFECEQMMVDMSDTKKLTYERQEKIEKIKRISQYGKDMLTAHNWVQRLVLFVRSNDVALGKRLRFFSFAFLHMVYRMVFFLKAKLKGGGT